MIEEKGQIETLIKLFNENKLDEVINECNKLINEKTKSPVIYNILGVCYFSKKKYTLSIQSLKKSIKLKSSYKDAYNNLGLVLKKIDKINDAILSFKKAIELDPKFYEAHLNLGVTLIEELHIGEAEKILVQAVKLAPNEAEIYNNMGVVKRYQGKFFYAEKFFSKAIKINKSFALAYRNLSLIKTFKDGDKEITDMIQIYKNNNIKDEERKDICFGLGKVFEDIKDYKRSFYFYKEGNNIKKNLINYDINNDKRLVSILKKKFCDYKENDNISFESNKKIPIFILGMPRSGTTLVEQIISSHSQVHGGGELSFVGDLVRKMNLVNTDIDFYKFKEFKKLYLNKISKISNEKKFVTDKNVHNFKWIGFILSSILDAKIIHVKRNSKAICWSNYKHHLNGDENGFCYDLVHICEFYRIYNELIDFWINLFPKKIYTIEYENLVNNQYQETEKLLSHLDLKFENSCIKFHQNERIVNTASTVQIRKKVYKHSSSQWKYYENFLRPYFYEL